MIYLKPNSLLIEELVNLTGRKDDVTVCETVYEYNFILFKEEIESYVSDKSK
jgi:hypothetical protein